MANTTVIRCIINAKICGPKYDEKQDIYAISKSLPKSFFYITKGKITTL